MLDLNTSVLDGAKLGFIELRAACDTVPFLAPVRLVIVEGLLARLAPAPQGGARPAGGGRNRAAADEEWAGLPGYAAAMPETTQLVLLDGAINERSSLVTALTSGPA